MIYFLASSHLTLIKMKLFLVIALVCFHTSQSRSIEKDCHGLSCEEYEETQDKIVKILNLINPAPAYSSPNYVKESLAPLDGTLDGCIRLTNEQADAMLNDLMHENSTTEEWKMVDFDKQRYRKWDIHTPIKYRMDTQFSSTEKGLIKKAISEWERNTCLRWHEEPFRSTLTEHHILFNRGKGCNSFVGKISRNPQVINFGQYCFGRFATLLHEIGHSLGLYHEQSRFDREQYIKINFDNINKDYVGNFYRHPSSVGMGLPYDYNSMMHYGPKDFSTNQKLTLEAKDTRFQHNFGQRAGFSFLDTKMINLGYCQNVCQTKLSRSCENDGYQDPNNCKQCKCPDGLGGQYCDNAAPSVHAKCGGTIHLKKDQESVTIETPGYSQGKIYDNFDECSWLISAPAQHKLKLSFANKFGVYQTGAGVCNHWLEVKAGKNIGENGQRLCGTSKPGDMVSTEERMLLVFKTSWNAHQYYRKGFKASITAVSDSANTDCVDSNDNCAMWAKRGECTKSSKYMLKYCKKSCHACDGESNSMNNPKTPVCEDKYETSKCKTWLSYCNDDSTAVPKGCKKTCNKC